MKNKIFYLYVLSALLFTVGAFAFADEPSSTFDSKPSGVTPSDTHSTYLNDLNKLIEKSSQNIKEANARIKEQAVLKRNQAREERANEDYKKGVDFSKKGELSEAREYFEKAIRISGDPEMSGYIKAGRQRHNAGSDDVEEVFKHAVGLYTQKKYELAKNAFEQVNNLAPNYRATDSYLKLISQDIQVSNALMSKRQAIKIHQTDEKATQVQAAYTQAIDLYKDRKFIEAKKKFEEVGVLAPNYKATKKYLNRIDRSIQEEIERSAQKQKKALQDQFREEKKSQWLAEHQKELSAQKVYNQALILYRNHRWEESKIQFEAVEQIIPDFKHAGQYLQKINVLLAQAALVNSPKILPAAIPVVEPAAVIPPQVAAVSLEDQQKQAQDVEALAQKSAQLYQQISDISDDHSIAQTKEKMAKVDAVINNLKENKERALRQTREEQFNRQQEELRAMKEKSKLNAQKMYKDGQGYFSAHEYARAKIKFLELEYTIPDYKATRRYLQQIEEGQKHEGVEAVTVYERKEAQHLKQLQDQENAEALRGEEEEKEKQHKIDQEEKLEVQNLAQRASSINDDILRLSHTQDYEAMKAKFIELENTVAALKALKDEMSKQKESQQKDNRLVHSIIRRNKDIRLEKSNKHIFAYEPQPLNHHFLSAQPTDTSYFKRREIMQEQNTLFNEGVDRYQHKKYTQAKLLFGELANLRDRRAEVWLRRVDRAITRELLKSQEGEERERTAFIAEQLKAQRELLVIQGHEHQRQKKLTEELERQKRLYEDDRLLQWRKEETMKVQDRERQRQEKKRMQLEKEKEKQQEMFRFHKIKMPPNPPVEKIKVQAVLKAPVAGPVVPSFLSAKLHPSKGQDQPVYVPQKSEREKQKEHQMELRIQREKDRQARLKEKDEKAALEKKHREELLRQKEQQRNEKIKKDQIIREDAQRKQELERKERQRQAELEAQRQAVRRQLEDGVEGMYQEALRLFKQGEYTAAADRFKDVEDILPGYKRTAQYLDEARTKSQETKPQDKSNPPIPSPSKPAPLAVTPSPTSSSHQDNVSKALDLFDPNAK